MIGSNPNEITTSLSIICYQLSNSVQNFQLFWVLNILKILILLILLNFKHLFEIWNLTKWYFQKNHINEIVGKIWNTVNIRSNLTCMENINSWVSELGSWILLIGIIALVFQMANELFARKVFTIIINIKYYNK